MEFNYAEQYFGKAQDYLYEKGVKEFIKGNHNRFRIIPRAMIVSALDQTLIITGSILISIENLAEVALNLLGVMFNFLSYVCGYNDQFGCSYGDALGSLEMALLSAAWVPIRIGLLPLTWSYQSVQIVLDGKDAKSYISLDDDD